MLSFTLGGVIGNPIAGVLIERSGFVAFGLAELAVIAVAALIAVLFMVYLKDRSNEPTSVREFWAGALPMTRRVRVRLLMGLRCLPTIFYGMLTVLVPLLLNTLSGNKALVAAYGTATLILASAASGGGRQPIAGEGVARPRRLPTIILAGVGLAARDGMGALPVWRAGVAAGRFHAMTCGY
jgi:hypothetical protein